MPDDKENLPKISLETEFGRLISKGNILHVKVKKASKYIAFEGPVALLRTATFVNANHLLDVVQDGVKIIIDLPSYDDENVDWDIDLMFDPSSKPLGKSSPFKVERITLPASKAKMHGEKVMYETAEFRDYIGYWVNPSDYVSWSFGVATTGEYIVEITIGCSPGQEGSTYEVDISGRKLIGKVRETGNWRTFTIDQVGKVLIESGEHVLTVRPASIAKGALMNIKRINLILIEIDAKDS